MTDPADKVVLVVDDKEPVRKILVHHLTSAGYKALEAESAAVAFRRAAIEKVDLILLDIMMPKLDGLSLLEKLKLEEKTKRIPVVMCTAKGFQEDVVRAARLGAKGYIVKPFKRDVVLDHVKKLIGEPPPPPPPPKKEKPAGSEMPKKAPVVKEAKEAAPPSKASTAAPPEASAAEGKAAPPESAKPGEPGKEVSS